MQIFTNLALGGAGAISASAHISPNLYVQMMQEMDNGDLISARATLYRLLPWIKMAFAEPNPAVIKAALSIQGLINNEFREPMQPCSSIKFECLKSVLSDLACQST